MENNPGRIIKLKFLGLGIGGYLYIPVDKNKYYV
jgi:hypothetical protein